MKFFSKLWLSFFEIYGGKIFDLLAGRRRLTLREDGRAQFCLVGLKEHQVKGEGGKGRGGMEMGVGDDWMGWGGRYLPAIAPVGGWRRSLSLRD